MNDEQNDHSTNRSRHDRALTGKQLDHLRGLAHSLKPVVTVGNSGVSDSVIAETDGALDHHELIKIRLPAIDRKDRRALLDQLAHKTAAQVVQTVGRIGTLYRAATDSRIELPGPGQPIRNKR